MTIDLLAIRRFDPDNGPPPTSLRSRGKILQCLESGGYEIGIIMTYAFGSILAHILWLFGLWRWGNVDKWNCDNEVALVVLHAICITIIFISLWEDINNYTHAKGFSNLFTPNPHSARILVDLCIAVAFLEDPTDSTIFCESIKESDTIRFLRNLAYTRNNAGTWIQLPGIMLTSLTIISLFRLGCNLLEGIYILITNWYARGSVRDT